jgi:hypothetical protein
MDPFLWNYVLEKGLEEDSLPMPNFTEWRNKDRAVTLGLAAPTTMVVVVPRRPGHQTLSVGWASPSRHRCPCHRPGCCCLPSNLVAVAIALAAVANARFVAHHPRPPLSPSPSPSPSPLCRHRHCSPATIVAVTMAFAAVAIASSSLATLTTIAIALATLTLPSLSPASLVTITITHVVAVAVAIALVAINRLPPLLPLLLSPKPLLSSLHYTLVANAIARFIPLALFVTRHPYRHRHCLAALTLFVTCSHR